VSSAGGGPHKEPEDPACTVYLANLDFSVTKRDIARWFDDGEGNIQQIRQANRVNEGI
jgi:hypothetical protein